MKITEMLLTDPNRRLYLKDMDTTANINVSQSRTLWSERSGYDIDVIVIHYISAVERHPLKPFKLEYIIDIFYEYGVSSHYLINRRGAVYRLVPDHFKAWHAGGTIMPEPDNRQRVNDFSIGIELLATKTSGFTKMQYRSLAVLCHEIENVINKKMMYVGHEHIAGERAVAMGIRNDVKIDPGSLFDWDFFFKELERNRCKDVVQLPI